MAERIVLYDLSHAQLTSLLTGWGEPPYRADQVWRWLYRSLAEEFAAMGNLPAGLRNRLAAETDLGLLSPRTEQRSASGQTQKVLFGLRDGQTIESVLMYYYERATACISTQVGCGMGCVFCATGQGGLVRSLSAGEIVAQVIHFARDLRSAEIRRAEAQHRQAQIQGHLVSHVVLMGMGEPLANYAATRQAINVLIDPRGYGLGARQITLSTAGLLPGIRKLASEPWPINLAVSLHAADDDLRSQLLPVNRRYPLSELMSAVRDYVQQTGRRVTFEYALIANVNDAPAQAQQLAVLLRGVLCHVNLIPLNPTADCPLERSPRERVDAFRDLLDEAGIPTTVRMRRGIDIEAGCGQLRQRQSDNVGR